MIAKINENALRILNEYFVQINNENKLFSFETLNVSYTFNHHGSLKT
jgi:hypothetical protein